MGAKIRQNYSSREILHAAMMALGELGYPNAKKIVKKILDDPNAANSMMNSIANPPPPPVEKISRLNAISFLNHHDFTKTDMISIKQKSSKCNADFLPCYDYILAEKIFCRPSRDLYFITETEACIPLKALALHTIDRILEIPTVKQPILEAKESGDGVVDLKYKQKVGNDT